MSITTPPKLMSKDAAARDLGCDRRTLSKIIDAYEIDPGGTSAVGHPLYDLEDLREALMNHKAAQLPPMTCEEQTGSLIALLEFHALMVDELAPLLPSETVRTAFEKAQEMRRAGLSPQFLWAKCG
jgi:hypothetical protein